MKTKLLYLFGLLLSTNAYAQPANDLCSNAVSLAMQASGTCTMGNYTNLGSTHESPMPSCDPDSIASVWFTTTTGPNQTSFLITVELGTMDWIVMDIFTDCAGGIDANLNQTCFSQGDNLLSQITGASPNTTYYIRVGNLPLFLDTQGDFDICISEYIPNPPANDVCSGAILVPIADSTGACVTSPMNTLDATQTNGGPHCAQTSDPDIWFKFNSGSNTIITPKIYAPDLGLFADPGMNEYYTYYDACGSKNIALSAFCSGDSIVGFDQNTEYLLKISLPREFLTNRIELCIVGKSNVGINETLTSKSINISPNPSSSMVNISLTHATSFQYQILDLTGKTILSKIVNSNSDRVDLNNIASGVYMIRVRSGDFQSTERLIVL
ncbi:MAG: hypothetical protein ACI8ZO_000473 [Flavobacteriales bacterium]|jgi:hypothetical protein